MKHRNNGRLAIRGAIIASVALSTLWLVARHSAGYVTRAQGAPLPAFRIGEILNYRVDWQSYTGVATAQLQIVDRGDFYGAPAWHFRAAIHTAQPLRTLYPMDDEIDSVALIPSLATRRYQEHYSEFGKPDDTDAALVSRGESSPAALPRVIVPQGTHDSLSAVYFLRATDWRTTHELRAPVYDGQNVYEMVATAGAQTEIRVAAGNYQATEIGIRLLDGKKEIHDEHFRIWLADDAVRTPLLCNADLSIGRLRIELTSDEALQAKAATTSITPRAGSNPREGN
jgi:hypothetical protein